MTYGIKMINGFDEEIVGDYPTFYEVAAGASINFVAPSGNQSFIWPVSILRENVSWNNGAYVLDPDEHYFSATAYQTVTIKDEGGNIRDFDWATPPYDLNALCFIDLPDAGILEMVSGYMPYTDLGEGPFFLTYPMPPDNAPFNYIWAGTDKSGLTVTEQYGMQIADAAGANVFDSRYPVVAVKDILIIPEADMQDVVENGTTKTYTLRTPVPNAKVHTPLFRCFAWQDYEKPNGDNKSRLWCAKMRQTNDTTIEVSQELFDGDGWTSFGTTNPGPTSGTYVHDVFLFLA